MTSPRDAAGLEAALGQLAQIDADVRAALARHGQPASRRREPGFATLLQIIVAQQVSTKAAATVWKRLETALDGEVTAARVAQAGETTLRTIGMSGRKASYALGLAEAVQAGLLDVDGLVTADDEAAIAAITALRGFGRWSAEIYLLFALGRGDVLPADDLALQAAFQRLKGLEVRPSGKVLRALAEPWRPWRGAGAVLLWHIYGQATLDR